MAKVMLLRSATQSTLLTGLVSYWRLNETSGTRLDVVGTNDLTVVNTVTAKPGKLSNGAEMLLADQASLQKSSPSNLNFNSSFTVAWWSYIYSLGEWGTYRGLINYYEAVPAGGPLWDRRGFLAKAAYNNVMAWIVGWGSGTTPDSPISHAPFSTNQWNLFIASADAENDLINITCNDGSDNIINVTNGTIEAPSASIPFVLGATAATDYADEIIDEVGIWNRLLTATEQTALYNSGSGITYPFTGI